LIYPSFSTTIFHNNSGLLLEDFQCAIVLSYESFNESMVSLEDFQWDMGIRLGSSIYSRPSTHKDTKKNPYKQAMWITFFVQFIPDFVLPI
jgi:hypothetical protein